VAIEVIRRILRKLYLEVRNALSAVNAFFAERLNGVEVIQLFSDEERSVTQARSLLAVHNDAAVKTNFWDALMYAIIDGLSSVCIALMLWYAAGGWIEATVATPGLFAAFLDAVARLFRPIQEFSAKIAILQRATTSLEKITGLLDEPIADRSGAQTVPAERVDLELRDLTFAYDKDHPVLHGISLKVGHGETVALVGRTGSGKSTIGKLATRTYDGWQGLLSAGGVPVTDWDLDALRRTIGQVRQDVQLFSGSVRFNLSLGREVDEVTLNRAIDQARARRVVDRLGGLDGSVEGNGGNVSSGEAQLLSLARTLVQDPPFVVLDEATASVDSLTEAAIQEATAELLSRKTVLVVAHRLSTVVGAHRIVVLDQGRIIEQGAHAELIAADGPYSRLFREQFEERVH
jgi:ATP-binding cassette subfamily B multidrug efflux pump